MRTHIFRFLAAVTALAAITLLYLPPEASADKPPHAGGGGGGGGGNTPPATGNIYYKTLSTWELTADGARTVELPAGVSGEPSQALHAGHRWFLRGGNTGVHNANGQVVWQLVAVRDDGARTVPLTNDPTLDVNFLAPTRWVGDTVGGLPLPDGEVAFVSNVRDVDGTIVGSEVLAALVDFDSDGVPFLMGQPATVLEDVIDYAFSPDGSLVVFEDQESLYVVDRVTHSVSPLLTTGPSPQTPQFSHSGPLIAYRSWDNGISGIHVATLDYDPTLGIYYVTSESRVASEKLRLKGTIGGNSVTSGPYWSPDGNYITYGLEKYGSWGVNYGVIRIKADGSNPTNLLSDDGNAIQLFVGSWR